MFYRLIDNCIWKLPKLKEISHLVLTIDKHRSLQQLLPEEGLEHLRVVQILYFKCLLDKMSFWLWLFLGDLFVFSKLVED